MDGAHLRTSELICPEQTIINGFHFPYPLIGRDVYFLATAAEDEEHVYEKALSGLNGWIDCFDKAELKGYVFCGGVTMGGEISGNAKLKEAYDMGAGV